MGWHGRFSRPHSRCGAVHVSGLGDSFSWRAQGKPRALVTCDLIGGSSGQLAYNQCLKRSRGLNANLACENEGLKRLKSQVCPGPTSSHDPAGAGQRPNPRKTFFAKSRGRQVAAQGAAARCVAVCALCLGAGAAAACRSQMCGRVCFGGWVLGAAVCRSQMCGRVWFGGRVLGVVGCRC